MTPTTNPIEDFFPVYKENRETQVYFKDANGEAMVVGLNTPEHDFLDARFAAFKSDKDASAVEVEESGVITGPTITPGEEKTEPTEDVPPESTETPSTESTEPVAPISDEVETTETVRVVNPAEPKNGDTQDTTETIGVDLAAVGTTSETVEVKSDEDTFNERVVGEAPQI